MKINITRIFFHIDLYKKCIVKKSQKCFYALLGMNILIFRYFHKGSSKTLGTGGEGEHKLGGPPNVGTGGGGNTI